MISTVDVVTVKYSGADKAKEGKAQYHGTFDRVYYSLGSDDEIETEDKIVDSTEGKVTYKVTSPKGKLTKMDASQLLMDAIADCEKRQNESVAAIKDEKKREDAEKSKVDPTILLLRYAESARANEARMAKYQELKPTVIDVDKTNIKFAEGLVQQGKAANLAEAYELMKKFGLM